MRRFSPICCASFLLAAMLVLPGANANALAADSRPASATDLGISLRTAANKLWVVEASGLASWSFRAGDQIVAVNGRRVSTEAAFMNRVSKAGSASVIVIARGGRLHTVGLPGTATTGTHAAGINTSATFSGNRGGGFLNPSQMVMTSQGAMHIEAARRLGLPHTPFPGRDH